MDTATGKRRKITARLRTQTPHAAMWVEQGLWHDVRKLEDAAKLFEDHIYTTIHGAFGSEWTPGIDRDPRINILHVADLGERVLGYTSSLDEYASEVFPLSNEAEMITVNLELVDIGSNRYNAVLSRELLRLVQWHQDRNEERWVKEGLSGLAIALTGAQGTQHHEAYLEQVDTSLTNWMHTDCSRGATYLFMTYFHHRFGDKGTRALTAEPANGVEGFEATLQELGAGLTFEDLLADWLAANYLDSVPGTDDTRYAYPDLDLPPLAASAVYDSYPVQFETSVHQFGADYIVLRGEEDLHIQFRGARQSPLLTGPSHVGDQVWWSNRADESLTCLTGRFNLREVEEATLTYRAWYDIEPHYDYATVEISVDRGHQWQILRPPSGTEDDPQGKNPGWGYTGESPGWIQEEIDISNYVGSEAWVRFSYLTDGAIMGEGLLLDDISVSEIDPEKVPDEDQEQIETDEWDARGFVLTDGLVSQDHLALLISQGEQIRVEKLPVGDDQRAEWTVPLDSEDLQEAVLILSGVTPRTRQPAAYQLTISQ